MRFSRLACLAVLLITPLWPAAVAQQEPSPPDPIPTFRSRTELITVPVIVTRRGRHVSGLTKQDFTVLEDGRPKPIAFFDEIKVEPAPPVQKPNAHDGVYTNEIASAGPGAPIVVLIDTLNTPYLYQHQAKKDFIKFLLQSFTWDRPIMIVQLRSTGLRVLHDFTNSPQALLASLNALHSTLEGNTNTDADRKFDRELRQVYGSIGNNNAARNAWNSFLKEANPLESEIGREQCDRSKVTLWSIQQLGGAMGALRGRKVLIWATGGPPLAVFGIGSPNLAKAMPPTGCSSLVAEYEKTWNVLSTANIAVYPVNIQAPEMDLDAPWVAGVPVAKTVFFTSVAEATSGESCGFRPDLETCFRNIIEDSSEYYLLSYYGERLKRPGWRKLKVSTSLQGVKVRARAGYLSLGADDDPELRRKPDVAVALVSPVDYTALPFTVKWTQIGQIGDQRKYSFEVRVKRNVLAIDRTDRNHFKLHTAVVAEDNEGTRVAEGTREIEAHLRPRELNGVERYGIVYRDAIITPVGQYRFRFLVRDALTGRLGTLTVPLPQGSLSQPTDDTAEEEVPWRPVDLPERLHIRAILQTRVTASKARVGDKLRLRVIKAEIEDGVLILPKGARLTGRVVEAVPLGKGSPESRLGILVERAEWKGNSVPLHAFLVAQGWAISLDWSSPTIEPQIKLRLLGSPPSGSVLVSRTTNVELPWGALLLLRNADASSKREVLGP